jgi:short subunit dehydrogenase-like uncharacterized protein
MIVVFGAAGYTGQRVARALERAGVSFRLAGRSPEKLRALAESLPSHPASLIADVLSPETLPPLFRNTRLLINCAGPFTDLGEPVARLAATHGVHYLDLTNELSYVYRLRQYDALARQTGAALVPACAFEVALADCLAALSARDLPQPLRAVNVIYVLPGRTVSYGTRLSALRTFAQSWLAYRGGKWVRGLPGGAVRGGEINGRPYRALAFPSCEVVTVPAHLAVSDVQAWLAVSRRWAGVAAGLLPLISVLLRSPLGALTALSFRRLMPPPPEDSSHDSRFVVQVELAHTHGTRTITARGADPYGLTAEIAAYAAQQLLAEGYDRRGVLAPAQALKAEAFVRWLVKQRVTIAGQLESSFVHPNK